MNETKKHLRNLIKVVLKYLFCVFDLVVPKKKNLVLFTAQNGKRYFDNSRYLFLQFIEAYSNTLEIKWIGSDVRIKEKIAKDGYLGRFIYQYSFKGLWVLLRANIIFITHGLNDIPIFGLSKRKKIIQLWHGIPLKKICMLDNKFNEEKKVKHLKEVSKYKFIICSSDIDRYAMCSCFGLHVDQVKITGLPRNDKLCKLDSSEVKFLKGKYGYSDKKIILYAPTFRDFDKTNFFPFDDFNIRELDSFLKYKDSYLLLRGHANDNIWTDNTLIYDDYKTERIVTANQDKYEDVQELLSVTDVLVTDYSSIYIDFLLLNRPMIFIPYDIEQYKKERGLLYDYDIVTPGPKIYTQKDFMNNLDMYLDRSDKDYEKREIVKKIFHKYEDGCSFKRIYNLIKKEII